MSPGQRPAITVSGPLGAGKTTLLNHLLRTSDRNLAVLVNDMGDVNVDARLVDHRSELGEGAGEIAELTNGCICCSMEGELVTTLAELAEHEFDALIVEASGISDPESLALTFARQPRVATSYDLRSMVTVVDAPRLLDLVETGSAGETAEAAPDRLAELLVSQIEFSDTILLNKTDLVDEALLDDLEETVETLQPAARRFRTVESAVDAETLLEVDRFDLRSIAESAGWKQILTELGEEGDEDDASHGDHDHDASNDAHDHDADPDGHDHADHADHDHADQDHADRTETFGVSSCTYRRGRPFHPERFESFLEGLPEHAMRSKGMFWAAGREDQSLGLNQVGGSVRVSGNGRWIASLPDHRQEIYREGREDLPWDEEWGDRETMLVFIGPGVEESAIEAALDDCLLTDREMDADWSTFENRFPTVEGQQVTIAEPEPSTTTRSNPEP